MKKKQMMQVKSIKTFIWNATSFSFKGISLYEI